MTRHIDWMHLAQNNYVHEKNRDEKIYVGNTEELYIFNLDKMLCLEISDKILVMWHQRTNISDITLKMLLLATEIYLLII